MKRILLSIISISILILLLSSFRTSTTDTAKEDAPLKEDNESFTITGTVLANETLDSIFSKYNLNKADLSEIYNESRREYNLSKISVGSVYSFELDRSEKIIQSMQLGIDDLSFLSVTRQPEGFSAEKVTQPVRRRMGEVYLNIKDNLISSMPGMHKEYLSLAIELSDIYAWDIDFSNDIRNGDSVKIIVEELWVGEAFLGFGKILAAEFINNGKLHPSFRFEHDGYVDYYDNRGNSLRKALLRSPLKFKYISSRFSRSHFHPKLRIYRPHLGVDYAAPTGTPVSAAGNGKIVFAGYKGQMGRMVRIKHPGGYETYYGHLSRIPSGMRYGTTISQGDIIGYVGSTGLATGPHLDYRIKLNGQFVNPLKISLPRGEPVPENLMTEFSKAVNSYNVRLDSITRPVVAFKENINIS